MMTIAEFLLARIAEDEAAARINTGGDLIPADCWSPERVLAECEAKRRIVEHHEDWQQTLYRDGGPKYDGSHETMYRMAMQWVVERLALPYADHPDYQEW